MANYAPKKFSRMGSKRKKFLKSNFSNMKSARKEAAVPFHGLDDA